MNIFRNKCDVRSISKKNIRLIMIFLLINFTTAVCILSCSKWLPKERIFPIEANHPWIIFDPTREQGLTYPVGDRSNPDILYLIFVGKSGKAMKINLTTKEMSPFQFSLAEWKNIDASTIQYEFADNWHYPTSPIQQEFRGSEEFKTVRHFFGDPVPNQVGNRNERIKTGYYYIIDKRNANEYELLRIKIENSELTYLGEIYHSPNWKWIIFIVDNTPSRTIIFNREEKVPERFQ